MSTIKTVHFEEVKDVMEQMLRTPIFKAAEKRMLGNLNQKALDPNLIMDVRHKLFHEPLSPTKSDILEKAKRLIFDEEMQALEQKKEEEMLESELKRFQLQLQKNRPRFRGPYTCSRRVLANSDDDQFWNEVSGGPVSKSAEKFHQSITEETVNSRGDNGIQKKLEEISYHCPIVVTIKDKPVTESREKQFELMRQAFLAFKQNVAQEKRLQELKIKVQEKITRQRLQRTFHIWRGYVNMARERAEKKKEGREMSKERKIELFINAIAEKQKETAKVQKTLPNKITAVGPTQRPETTNTSVSRKTLARTVVVVDPPAHNRLNTQKRIIAEQKVKLAEQNKIIEELKLKQLQKETHEATKETVNVAKDVLVHCGRQTRRSIIQLMREEGCKNKSMMELPRLPSPPRFLLRMEARAEARRERSRRTQEERERKIEEQRKREEAERKAEEEERKRLQLEAQKETKRQREEQEQRRAREAEKNRQLNKTADDFRRKYLLRRYVMEPFFKIIEMKYNYIKTADEHYQKSLLRKTLTRWIKGYREAVSMKMELAITVCNRNLLWYTFRDWQDFAKSEAKKMQVAIDFYDMRLLEGCLKSWNAAAIESKLIYSENERIAREHFTQRLRVKFFARWKMFPSIARDLKEKEKRKDKWRQMVQRVIPDFDPKQRGVAIED